MSYKRKPTYVYQYRSWDWRPTEKFISILYRFRIISSYGVSQPGIGSDLRTVRIHWPS